MSDEITLTLPRVREFVRIAHLVLGGLAVRLDLTFENLEDLQVALAGLLDRPDGEGFVTLAVRVDEGTLYARVGPFDDSLQAELEREPEEGVGLRRVLETVVDRIDLGKRNGGTWIELTKSVEAVER